MNLENVKLDTDLKKASYAIGQQIGNSLESQGIEVDAIALAASIDDYLAGRDSRLSDTEMMQALSKLQSAQQEKDAELAQANLAIGEKYLAENRSKPNVKTTASGLQYEVLTEGAGAMPSATSTVQVHYRGTLLNGKEFDSSYKRNQPAEFPLNRVIRGWTEGLQLMKAGGKNRFVIPANLAYGDQGNAGIPPNSTLIFEVELLAVR